MLRELRSVSGSVARHETLKGKKNSRSIIEDETFNGEVKLAWLGKRKTEGKLQLLLEQLKHYCDNSSLAGYKYITETRRTWFERIMWVVLHLVMIYSLGLIVWNVLQDYEHTPVVTVVDSDHYPSSLLDLPAVSVCSINRISRKAVLRLAERIKFTNISPLSYDNIVNLLGELGKLYETSFDKFHENENDLDDLLTEFFDGDYDLTKLMKELTPQCSDILVKCRFRSESKNCSDLFSFRKTQDGFCCTFNYAREVDDIFGPVINRQTKPHKIERLGQMNGLTFLMEPLLDDYFFPILPITGWKITIFNPDDYPDNTSGGVSDALISPGTENYLELNAVSFYSEKAVRSFDVHERKCIFSDEVTALYDGYTYSDCIVDCKVDDIWETCGCRPFYYPKRDSRRVCNTSDADCLTKFKSKWWSVLPHEIKQGGEEAKVFNFISNESWSLHCKRCYPSCDDTRYYLQTSSVTLEKKPTSFLSNLKIVDQSLVHIFFSKYGTIRLKQDVAYYWYELLSNIGGICGVFIGFSLISAVEFIYFIVLLGASLFGSKGLEPRTNETVAENQIENKVRPLYWDELAPRGSLGKIIGKNSRNRRAIKH